MELDLVKVRCSRCKSKDISMESILNNLRCRRSCNRQDVVEAEIQVKVGSMLGAYEVQRVALIHPRNLRSEVEGVLSIDKQYKTI